MRVYHPHSLPKTILTLGIFKHGFQNCCFQVLMADFLSILAGSPKVQSHLVNLLSSCVATEEGGQALEKDFLLA